MLIATFLLNSALFAQRDTTHKQTIDITSSYKPVLRNAIKINFSGTHLSADTSRRVSPYNIPSQNLIYSYSPIALNPLALQQDTNIYLGNRYLVKAGFGSYSTPYLLAKASLGDGRKRLLNLSGKYIQSTGGIKNQDYSQLSVSGDGSYFTKAHEIYGSVGMSSDNYYLYGYDHALFTPEKTQIQQQLREVNVSAATRNTTVNELGISYNPSVTLNIFSNIDKASETTIGIHLPAQKVIAEKFLVKAAFHGDFTNYNTKGLPANVSLPDNVITFNPSVEFAQQRLKIHAGISPSWNNGVFQWLPDVSLEAQVQEKVLLFQAGWIGRITKNTLRNIERYNPYVERLYSLDNTKETEFYGGLKGSVGKHLNVNVKASWITYDNFPLFLSDTAYNSTVFTVSNEERMYDLRIHGDIGYINQDKFSLTGGVTLNGYTGIKNHAKAWNTLPLEITGSMRWWAYKRLLIKGDIYIFGGANSNADQVAVSLKGGTDLSAGLEFKINKQFSVWLDANNILDDRYERWRNYPVYGINFLGGIIVNF